MEGAGWREVEWRRQGGDGQCSSWRETVVHRREAWIAQRGALRINSDALDNRLDAACWFLSALARVLVCKVHTFGNFLLSQTVE